MSAAAVLAACGGGGGSGEADSVRQATAAKESRSKATFSAVPARGTAIDTRLRNAGGEIDVWVQLDQNSLARTRATIANTTGVQRVRPLAMAGGARATESSAVLSALASQRASLVAQQAQAGQRLAALGAKELGRVKVAHNAIAVRINASQLKAVAALPGVKAVRPVVHPKLDLSETVPYVGGAAVQATGITGAGVRVAVLDSGIDYTHKNLGGAGTLAAYEAAWGTSTSDPRNTTRDGLFPTAKVVDGFDFVGETWTPTSGTRTEDPDPIDFEGHGTHVADIIAGKSTDGTHVGMAPGASLVAVKVCSAVSSSCNGVALLKGVDFALDPNGDGDFSDAVDVMNLSLGSGYGQIEDDLTQALTNAVDLGVVVVASAGNSANRPYITGSPSIAPGVIGVAQTQTPSSKTFPVVVNSPAVIAGVYTNTATLDWAPVGDGATGDIKTALQAGAADNRACTPLPANSLAGKVALIDRGGCAISIKVDNAAKAGAIGVLIALIAPGDAVSFSFGGGDTFVPSLVIQQSLGNSIKGQLSTGVNVSFSSASAIALVGSMAGTSSRGPAYGTHLIKPEIGAPGASLSAEAGTGDGQTVFGGTSGAAPMVAGAAVLMVEALPTASVMQIKAMLMNSADTMVFTNPATLPGELAPITRIGAGELRVNRAVALTSFAWDQQALSATLGFGAPEVDRTVTLSRSLTVTNTGSSAKTFTVTPGFRYASDEASGAVSVSAPASVQVPAGGSRNITVRITIDPAKLPEWVMNGGSNGGNGALLNTVEFDGYLTLTAGNEKLSVPWHVLPRKAARTTAQGGSQRSADGPLLNNRGVGDGGFDLFSLTGRSAQQPADVLPKPGDNFAIVDLRSTGARYLAEDVCGVAGGCVEFAISTYGRRSHPNYPAAFEVGVDNNGDGVEDFVIFNAEQTGFAATGQNIVAVRPATSTTGTIFFFADADLNSGNIILTAPLSALGGAVGSTLGFNVRAFDNYFTGALTDEITGMRFTPGASRFSAPAGGFPFGVVPGLSSGRVPFATASVPRSATTETGLLMMYRTNAGNESQELLIR